MVEKVVELLKAEVVIDEVLRPNIGLHLGAGSNSEDSKSRKQHQNNNLHFGVDYEFGEVLSQELLHEAFSDVEIVVFELLGLLLRLGRLAVFGLFPG